MNEAGLKRDVIVIGASLGGVQALRELCIGLPAELPAVVGVVLHRSPWHRIDLGSLYGRGARIRVREATVHEALQPGTVYLAPPDRHMLFGATRIALSRGPKVHFVRPAVDVLFNSAAASFGRRVAGVLLTGGGSDGAQGLVAIKQHDGITLVQQPAEARDATMPLTGIMKDSPDAVVRLKQLPELLWELALGHVMPIEAAAKTGTAGPRSTGA